MEKSRELFLSATYEKQYSLFKKQTIFIGQKKLEERKVCRSHFYTSAMLTDSKFNPRCMRSRHGHLIRALGKLAQQGTKPYPALLLHRPGTWLLLPQ